MSEREFFLASAIQIGCCGSPTCRNVHIQLCDEDGVAWAQGIVDAGQVDAICADLRAMKDEVLGASGTISMRCH